MDQTDFLWLFGSEAERRLHDLAADDRPLHQLVSALRGELSASRVALLLEQHELRGRAAKKFSNAQSMFFTRQGLEQATDEWIAAYKAKRFFHQGRVADLCCGVGGDLLGLAGRGETRAVDRSEFAVKIACANAEANGLADVEGVVADASPSTIVNCEAWHIDPDRRPQGRRTTRVSLHSPDDASIEALHERSPNGAIKLSPAAMLPEAWRTTRELEWISRARECRQLVVWSGDLAHAPGKRRASLLDDSGELLGTFVARREATPTIAQRLDRYLFEPDPAVLASQLTDELARHRQLERVAPGIGYLTGANAVQDALLATFEIEAVLPLRIKQLARHLRSLGVGRLEIKHRGVALDPDRLRSKLRLRGEKQRTLIATLQDGKPITIVAHRVPRNG